MFRLNVLQAKRRADRALAFCNVTTTKSFASVVAGKWDRGFSTSTHKQSAGRSKVFNTNAVPFAPYKQVHRNTSFKSHRNAVGGVSGVLLQNSTPTGEAVKVHHCRPTSVKNPVTNDQVFKIPCANRFQLLASMESSGTDNQKGLGFESSPVSDLMDFDGLSDDHLPVTKVTPMANTPATTLNNQKVDVCNNREGLGLVDGQQSTITGCTDFLMSTQQLGSNFGCIPLTPILLYQGTQRVWQNVPEVLQAHRMIRDSGVPNFMGLHIPVKTNLKIASWRAHLCDYFDKQLCDLMEFGFPLDFDRSRHLESTLVNHASARNFSDHIDEYLREELQFQAILRPFDDPPIKMHISPFMTREKSRSDSCRAIIDLSFPKGSSLNDGVAKNSYLGTEFQMHYPSVDSII